LIDIGVNLTNSRFDKDVGDVISRAYEAGIQHMLVTGTSVLESQKALTLCQQFTKNLSCTVGIHPHDADNASKTFLRELETLADSSAVKAIGECGLDFNRNFSTPDNQKTVFLEQVKLAQKLELPLFLHQRDAFDDWFEILTPYFDTIPAMVSHCFTGNAEQLSRCLEAGMYIGITGWVCDERRGQGLRDIITDIPLERLMIETDAPYLTPRTIKPRPKSSRNEPSYLAYIVKEISSITGYTEQQIKMHSTENARRVFNLELAE
jgi:TatD DNase family protein